MIGGMIEDLKNPKNVFPTLCIAFGAAVGGYFWSVYFRRWDVVGDVLGFLGVAFLAFTLFRVAVTRIVFLVLVGVLVVVYGGWYLKACKPTEETLQFNHEWAPWQEETRSRMRPKYTDIKISEKDVSMSQLTAEVVFAAAYLLDSIVLRRGRWRTDTAIEGLDWNWNPGGKKP